MDGRLGGGVSKKKTLGFAGLSVGAVVLVIGLTMLGMSLSERGLGVDKQGHPGGSAGDSAGGTPGLADPDDPGYGSDDDAAGGLPPDTGAPDTTRHVPSATSTTLPFPVRTTFRPGWTPPTNAAKPSWTRSGDCYYHEVDDGWELICVSGSPTDTGTSTPTDSGTPTDTGTPTDSGTPTGTGSPTASGGPGN